MPQLTCPIAQCTWKSQDLDAAFAAALATSLQAHLAHVHPTDASVKPEKLPRPSISTGVTTEEWNYFTSLWESYRDATKLSTADSRTQLLACCDTDLRRDLHRTDSQLCSKSVDVILSTIRSLAVREENTLVSRLTLHSMRQDRDEGTRNFAARLRGQANVCKFTIRCSCDPGMDVNFGDQMIRDVLIRGLYDPDIQQEILGNEDQDLSLESTIKFIEAKEAGRRSQASLTTEGAHASSQYKKQNSGATSVDRTAKCKKCQEQFTRPLDQGGRVRPHKMCKSCFKQRSPVTPRNNTDAVSEESGIMIDDVCTAVGTSPMKRQPVVLSHHVFSDGKGWLQRRSLPQPVVTVTASVCKDDYVHFGVYLRTIPRGGNVSAIADTGCQSCLIGSKIVRSLGFKERDLLNVELRMNAVNQQAITISGAVILRLTGLDNGGHPLQTTQICYVTPDTEKLFLSREACVDLGLISSSFPAFGEASSMTIKDTDIPTSYSVKEAMSDSERCDCPKRSMPPPLPSTIPFPATEANVEKLKQWLLQHYAASTFNVCPHSQLPLMTGPPLALMVDPDATPVAVHSPIPVPLHWQDKVKAGLDRDVSLGVIEPVPVGNPVTWCHRMVVCRKKNGQPRRTVDLQALNKHCARETHHTPSPFHQAMSVPSGKKKSVFDAWNGYHSVPIRECDRHLTTFITPWGRYRYCTTPQGYIASGDGYTRRFDEIISDFPNKTKCIDDTCMWADSIEECFFQACQWLDLCGRNGIILNPEKFSFAQDTVEFAGFDISLDKVKPCCRYLDAIRQFPTPATITDVRSWFGLINQVSYYASMAEKMRPFRDLLKPKIPFYWDSQLQQLFEESKKHILESIEHGITIFDKGRSTCLVTDFSKDGIGFFLLQKHCNCANVEPFCCRDGWKITLVGSRFTHPAESRYAPIEGEALAVADALERTKYFVLGCDDLIVAVDHQPLLKVLGDRKLEDIKNARLFNLKEKTLPFKFKIIHLPGRKNLASDALSRHPHGSPSNEKLLLPDDVHAISEEEHISISSKSIRNTILTELRLEDHHVNFIETDLAAAAGHALDDLQAVTWDRVREATTSDPVTFELLQMVEDGLPDSKAQYPAPLRDYFNFREHLSTAGGVVLYKDRIVVPPVLREEVLLALHSAHQGVASMTARANISVFWPGITAQIANLRERCTECNRIAPSQPSAPPTALVEPEYPFQCICADFFSYKGVHYLIIVDRYSNWPIVRRTHRADGLITCLREEFTTYGIPEELSSDGGSEFIAAETQAFLKAWGVHHRVSSVAFPHSNCRAEVGVKSCKRIIMNNTGPNGELDVPKFQRAMLQYRNAPDQDTKMSPAMIVFGRCVRDFIPVPRGRYKPQQAWIDNAGLREAALRKRHMRKAEELHLKTKRLPPLRVGDRVRIQNQVGKEPLRWDKTGIVVEVRQYDQYVVRVDGSGRVTLRNRKFLRSFQLYKPSTHSPTTAIPTLSRDASAPSTTKVPEAPPLGSQHTVPPPGEPSIPEPLDDHPTCIPEPVPLPDAHNREPFPTPPTLPAPNVEDIRTPAPVTQPLAQSPVPCENRRPRRNIVPPVRYDPAVWDLT